MYNAAPGCQNVLSGFPLSPMPEISVVHAFSWWSFLMCFLHKQSRQTTRQYSQHPEGEETDCIHTHLMHLQTVVQDDQFHGINQAEEQTRRCTRHQKCRPQDDHQHGAQLWLGCCVSVMFQILSPLVIIQPQISKFSGMPSFCCIQLYCLLFWIKPVTSQSPVTGFKFDMKQFYCVNRQISHHFQVAFIMSR